MHLLAALVVTVLPPVITIDDALRIFREQGFDLLIADAQVAAAAGDATAATAIANPQLGATVGRSFDYDARACPGCSATAWSVALTDPSALSDLITGKRGLRADVARAAVAAARRSRDDALRTLSLQVRQAVLDTALQQAQVGLARELAESTERTRALDQRRLESGAVSEAELARAEVAALQAQQGVDLVEQALIAARLQLAFLLGVREPAPEFAVDSTLFDRALPETDLSLDALWREALEERPDLLAASAQEARAEAALALARRQRIPDFALSAQYAQEGSGQNALQPPTVTLGAQFPLPIFNRQAGEISRAEADLRSQRIAREKLRAQALAEVRQATAAVDANRRLVQRLRTRLLGRARRVRDLVQVQYEKGAASLLELLDAQRTWAQTYADYLKDVHDFWLSAFRLDAVVGRR
ncbi:MAG TPA: TolC family protein [Myxococcales bacterium]|nr:TolC family protein [Myxococcales bacterium]